MSDKITPEQLREWAYDRSGIIDADWLSDQLRAHADALEENARLLAFRNYFADKCEGLFFQFGMEVIDLYNATHGREVCRIEPERAYLHEESK